MSHFLSFFTKNTVSSETGHLLLLVYVFWLTCLWYLIMQFLVWEIILFLYKLKPIQIFQQVSACSCVQKCRSTPIAVLLSPLCTPMCFGIYFEITLTVVRTSWATYRGLSWWLGLPLFWPTPHTSCTSLLCPCVLCCYALPLPLPCFLLSIWFKTPAPNTSSLPTRQTLLC